MKRRPLPREQERALAVRAKAGDAKARMLLIESNMGLVWAIGHTLKGYGVPLEDLVSAGYVGLVEAFVKYDPDSGNKYITYASWWVRARMYAHIYEVAEIVSLPNSKCAEVYFKLKKLRARLGEDATDAAIARLLDTTESQITDVSFWVDRPSVSTSFELPSEVRMTIGDMLRAAGPSPEECAEQSEESAHRKALVDRAMACLLPRERFIIERRLLRDEEETLGEIGERLGVSRERVRQIEVKAIDKMRAVLCNKRRGQCRDHGDTTFGVGLDDVAIEGHPSNSNSAALEHREATGCD